MYADEDAGIVWNVCIDGRIRALDLTSLQEKLVYSPPISVNNRIVTGCHAFRRTPSHAYIIMGTLDGRLVVWDLDRGIILRSIALPATPNHCCIANDNNSLFLSLHNSICVHQYDTQTGKEINSIKTGKKPVHQLALNPKAAVLAVTTSSTVKLLDIDSGRRKKIQLACPHGIATLTFSPCGKYLLVNGRSECEVLVINVLAEAPVAPIAVIPLPATVQQFHIHTKSTKVIDVLCLYDGLGGMLLRFDERSGEQGVLSRGLDTTIQWDGGFFPRTPATLTLIQRGATGSSNNSSLQAHVISVEDAEGRFSTEAVSILVKSAGRLPPRDGAGAPPADLMVLGPLEAGGKKRPLIESDGTPFTKKSRGEEEDATAVQTLEEKLELLSRSMGDLESRAGVPDPSMAEQPTADSLVPLVDQALQSGDDALLEQCLSCTDVGTIEATAERLPTGRVLLLLKRLVAKFEKRPSRGILLTRWLSAILRHHMSFLISLPDLASQLAGLTQMLEQRLNSYARLSGLGGRLDLLLAQASHQSSSSRSSKAGTAAPKTTFIDE